jgi:hypothetical protein
MTFPGRTLRKGLDMLCWLSSYGIFWIVTVMSGESPEVRL